MTTPDHLTPAAFVVWLEYNWTNNTDTEATHIAVRRSALTHEATAADCATMEQLFECVLADTHGEEEDQMRAHLGESLLQFESWVYRTRLRHTKSTADWRKRRHLDGNA